MTIPSHKIIVGSTFAVREGSQQRALFENFAENHQSAGVPGWLKFDAKKMTGEVTGTPTYQPAETLFDPAQVLEYYSR